MKYTVYSQFTCEQTIYRAYQAILSGDPNKALGMVVEAGAWLERQTEVDRAIECYEYELKNPKGYL